MEGSKRKQKVVLALTSCLSSLAALYQLSFVLIALTNWVYQQRLMLELTKLDQTLTCTRRNKAIVRQRNLWVRPDPCEIWWNNFLNDVVVPEEWMENFRMSKYSFMKLCEEL